MNADPTLHPAILLIILILAVIAGLWVGAQLGHASRKGKGKSLGKQAQGVLSDAVVRLWKMQRARAKARREPTQE
ncbi:MAG: hypothetical protein IPK80_12120 [Nannocystis sp.]|nr:hypothetical protein [Nannocystis sp.]